MANAAWSRRVNLNEWFTLSAGTMARIVMAYERRPSLRIILALWFIPLSLFWGWYALSANNIHFGYVMLSRQVHDLVFQVYANTLGIEAERIPGLIAGACAVDTAIIMAIAAFRWRASWLPQARSMFDSYWNGGEEKGVEYAGEYTSGAGLSEDYASGRARPAE